ncbi:MAG: flagellar export chaperone FliS [Gammaproteobacteria bacterium]|nr:flagellar export chaperone FliS [Gammaproteobacteria bacterium]
MTFGRPELALDHYKQAATHGKVAEADPNKLILLLLDGAIERIHVAKGHLQRKAVAKKGEYIGRSVSIIDALRASLDKDQGGEIAANLDNLYDYMCRRLLAANLENRPEYLDEVADLLEQLRAGWSVLSDAARK